MGDTYGSAYVAMGARSISDADMVFAWDDAKVGMMEAEKQQISYLQLKERKQLKNRQLLMKENRMP